MVIINNRLDPISGLYYKGKFIGIIKNDTALLDVCAQIHKEQAEGYSIRFNHKNYDIAKDGHVLNPPSGFYDSSDKSLEIIFGIYD